ncbi:hypothetical protein BD410DRAFT_807226 [Rickenella mellea]|uniref:Uncharacterized protein n=1 Tax=Rickenella mellea TaxID=50990 RepID=A0A4Y7PQA3_9AGAM|nr:hypothetical protein BD410DRAFT_807226 [Rickenella mellea]
MLSRRIFHKKQALNFKLLFVAFKTFLPHYAVKDIRAEEGCRMVVVARLWQIDVGGVGVHPKHLQNNLIRQRQYPRLANPRTGRAGQLQSLNPRQLQPARESKSCGGLQDAMSKDRDDLDRAPKHSSRALLPQPHPKMKSPLSDTVQIDWKMDPRSVAYHEICPPCLSWPPTCDKSDDDVDDMPGNRPQATPSSFPLAMEDNPAINDSTAMVIQVPHT